MTIAARAQAAALPGRARAADATKNVGQLAGYAQRYEWENNATLVFATVRGAGHQVPTFQPERAFAMARRFLYNGTLFT